MKILIRHGFYVDRQSGSHIQLIHPDGRYVTVPRHDPIKEGTLKAILFQANITNMQNLTDPKVCVPLAVQKLVSKLLTQISVIRFS